MIFRMEQQRVLLPQLVCQNGNCPPSRRVLRLMSLMTPRNARGGGGGEAGKELDGRTDESAEVWPTSALSKTAGGREDHGTG